MYKYLDAAMSRCDSMPITAEQKSKPDERIKALEEAEKAIYDKQIISGSRRLKLAQSLAQRLGPESGFYESDVVRISVDALASMLAEGEYEEAEEAFRRLKLPAEVMHLAELKALELCLASDNNARVDHLSNLLNPTGAELVKVQLAALHRIMQTEENESKYDYDIFLQALKLVNYVSEHKDQLSAAELKEYNQHAIKIYEKSLQIEMTISYPRESVIQALKERSYILGLDPEDIAATKAKSYNWALDNISSLNKTAYGLLRGLDMPKSYVAAEGKKAIDRLLLDMQAGPYLNANELYNVITLSGFGPEVMKEVGMKLHNRALELHRTDEDITICKRFGLGNLVVEAVTNHYTKLLESDPYGALSFARDYDMEPDKKHKAAVETYRWLKYMEYHITWPSGIRWPSEYQTHLAVKDLKGDFGLTKAEMKEIDRSILPKLNHKDALKLAKEIGDKELVADYTKKYYEALAESDYHYYLTDIIPALPNMKNYVSRDVYEKAIEKSIAVGLGLLTQFDYRTGEVRGPYQDILESLKGLLDEAKSIGISDKAEAIGQKAFLDAVSDGRFTTAYYIAVAMDYPRAVVERASKLKDIIGEMPPNKNLNLLRKPA